MALNRNEFFHQLFDEVADGLANGLGIRVSYGAPAPSQDIFVSVFLRGACDGLNFVTPISGEDRKIYESARPNIQMPLTAAKPEDALLKLDDRFGLHPSAKPLFELFKKKELAIVHAAGLTINSRSHFDAQLLMELGTPERKTTRTGWLTRYVDSSRITRAHSTDISAVAIGNLLPASYQNESKAAVMGPIEQMNLGGNKKLQTAQTAALEAMYSGSPGSHWLLRSGANALQTMARLQNSSAPGTSSPTPVADYGGNEIGNRMKTLAKLIKLRLGVRVAAVDMGGWDTHRYQGQASEGRFAQNVKQLSQALAAFHQDVGDVPVTTVVMSEFGRRLKENANRGTDHGHGNIMIALGGSVNGGLVYGNFPGLRTENLYERADLAITTDYREVLSEMLVQRMKYNKTEAVFPGFRPSKNLGIFKKA